MLCIDIGLRGKRAESCTKAVTEISQRLLCDIEPFVYVFMCLGAVEPWGLVWALLQVAELALH